MPPRPSTALRALKSTRFASTSSIPLSSLSSQASSSSIPPTPTPTPAPSSSKPVADPNRIYTPRKTFLWNYYTHLISTSELILVFDHSNLTSSEWSKIRRSIDSIPLPLKPYDPAHLLTEGAEPIQKASLNVVRTGVLSSLLSNSPKFTAYPTSFPDSFVGQRALLTCPTLSPTYLNKILNSLNRSLKSLKRENTKDEKQPSLKLVIGLLENKQLYSEKQLKDEISKLPELDGLRGQLIGLLQAQPSQLIGLLNQAKGGQLVRTLQGLEESLKGPESGGEEQQKSA